MLQKEVAKLKDIAEIEQYNQYLSKYNISLNKKSYSQISKNYRVKEDRIKYW